VSTPFALKPQLGIPPLPLLARDLYEADTLVILTRPETHTVRIHSLGESVQAWSAGWPTLPPYPLSIIAFSPRSIQKEKKVVYGINACGMAHWYQTKINLNRAAARDQCAHCCTHCCVPVNGQAIYSNTNTRNHLDNNHKRCSTHQKQLRGNGLLAFDRSKVDDISMHSTCKRTLYIYLHVIKRLTCITSVHEKQ
jgi:hypothetical protein